MEVIVNTLEKVQKQKSTIQGEFLKICQKVSQATFAMSEVGSLFSNVVKEIASFFPPGDIGSVINDISGYSNDINEVFKLWSEKMRGEFMEGFMKSVDSMTKEMNDKIKEVQTKRAIFGKDISRAENFVFKAEKSQNEAQIASAVRDLNQKKDEIEKSESNLLLDVYLLQRRNGIFFIEKYIDFSQVYTLFGDVIRSLLTDVERWKSICSLKDLLTPEQIDTMQISREVQNLTDSSGNMEIHTEKFKVTEPYKSTRETRFQQHHSPPPLPKFPEDTTSPEGRSPRRPHVISPRSSDPRMGKLRSTSNISSPTHHREALSPRLNTSRGVIQEDSELDPPPPNYIPKPPPPGTQDIFENLTISWPTDIKHKPISELSLEWDKQEQVEDKLQQVEEASTQGSSTPRHKTTTVLSNTQQGIVEGNKGSGSMGGSTTTEPDFPCSLQEPKEALLFQNDLPLEKNNSSDSSVSLNRHNNNQEGISDKNNQESERRFPTQRLTSRSVSIPHDCNLHSNTVPSPVCRTATVSGRTLRTPKQDAEDRALCVELGSWQTPTYPNSWAVKDVTNRQGGLASPKQRMNPLFLSSPRSTETSTVLVSPRSTTETSTVLVSPRSTTETSTVLVSPRSIAENSTVSTPRAVIESMNPLQLQAISPSVSPDGDTPRRPLTQRMLSTKAIPRPSLGQQSSSQSLLSSTSRDSPTSPRIPSPILRKIPTGGSDNSDKRKLDIPIMSLQQQDWDDIELLVDTNLSIVSDVL